MDYVWGEIEEVIRKVRTRYRPPIASISNYLPFQFVEGTYSDTNKLPRYNRVNHHGELTDTQIREVIGFFGDRKMQWACPKEFQECVVPVLEELGLWYSTTIYGMYLDIINYRPKFTGSMTIDELDVEEYLSAMNFEIPADQWKTHLKYNQQLDQMIRWSRYAVKDKDGIYAATSDIMIFEIDNYRVGYLSGAHTRKEVRKQGMYTALLDHRINQFRDEVDIFVVYAQFNTSAPILRKRGFVDVCKQFLYRK